MKCTTALLLIFLTAHRIWAHAIEADAIAGGIGVAARYADGSPAAFAEVKVFAPGDTNAFQEGLTDREGRFLFQPATGGVWRITIDDGMGHVVEKDLSAETTPSPIASPGTRPARAWPLITGVSLIWGFFGTWGWWRARRR